MSQPIPTSVTGQVRIELPMYEGVEDAPAFSIRILRRKQTKAIGFIMERMRAIQSAMVKGEDAAADDDPDASTQTQLDAIIDEIVEVMGTVICAWENVTDLTGNTVEYKPELIEECLNERELVELLSLARNSAFLDGEDRKKSA